MEQDEMDAMFKRIRLDIAQYDLRPGTVVDLGAEHGTYIVALTILGKRMESQLRDRRIWKLFTLVNLSCGITWAAPIPVMSEGTIDIRKLLRGGDDERARVTKVTYQGGLEEKKRKYLVEWEGKRTFEATVSN